MSMWLEELQVNPIPTPLAAEDEALAYFVRHDLLREEVGPVDQLWDMAVVQKLLRKQQEDGSWRYPGKNREVYPETNYDLLETFRSLGQLISKYGLDRRMAAVAGAAEYVLSCQTDEGDIRGILGTQYMPYYHGALLELLIKAGYEDDTRIEKGLESLLSMRQDDGGWIVPMQAVPAREKTREVWSAPPVPPDRSLPFSHLATGMALRALAAHPRYRHREETRAAAEGLKSRFFKTDRYNDRKAPAYWTKFQYPFWWSNLLAALDSLSLIGFSRDDSDVQKGLAWFRSHQEDDGLWPTSYERGGAKDVRPKEQAARLWVGLAVCRVFQRFYS